ncbi:MAG: ABC transporter ATP-binding protein [Candidatus Pacebacteria bacterium]|nr:ABC transporter ATP-binding protein [Candidatus Paceibacterota bacterium]
MKNFKKLIQYFWKYIREYKVAFIGNFILFGAMVAITDIVTPIYIKDLTNALTELQIGSAYKILMIILLLWILGRIFLFASMHLLSWFEIKLYKRIQKDSFEDFTKHDYHFYVNNFTGSLVEKSTRIGKNFVQILDNALFQVFSLFIGIIGSLVILFNQHVYIGIAFIIFLVVYIILTLWANKKLAPLHEQKSRVRSEFRGVSSDIISNIQTIMFFGNRFYDLERFHNKNLEEANMSLRVWRTSINYEQGISLLAPLFTLGVTFYALSLFQQDLLSVGAVILVFSMANSVNSQIWRLGGISRNLVASIGDTVEAIEIIERVPDVLDVDKPEPITISRGFIHFDNVSFSYPDGEHVFEKFNLSITEGERIGVVGKSGSGKTSLTKLLLRLYDLDKGSITIDGQDISKVAQEDLRKNIAYIPQDTILFHRSILDNIHYGNLNATQDEVMEAARAAYVDEFVHNLENGYETMVGERGIKLSGGQRQRVGIARAMLKKEAPILIMDEATSALDSKSEFYIQESFEKLSEGRTTVVIAHRLSTIQKMDRIIVMDKGAIIEEGNHEELLKKNGYYAELWNSQINGFIEDDTE